MTGPPPRAWGQRCSYFVSECRVNRPTPTSMGTTVLRFGKSSSSPPAHPHEHGDNTIILVTFLLEFRPTPTSMGTTGVCDIGEVGRPGPPPRAWGQRGCSAMPQLIISGPPPRAWGQPISSPFTPHTAPGPPPRAWGQRNLINTIRTALLAHPHEHGDNATTEKGRYARTRPTPTSMGTT